MMQSHLLDGVHFCLFGFSLTGVRGCVGERGSPGYREQRAATSESAGAHTIRLVPKSMEDLRSSGSSSKLILPRTGEGALGEEERLPMTNVESDGYSTLRILSGPDFYIPRSKSAIGNYLKRLSGCAKTS